MGLLNTFNHKITKPKTELNTDELISRRFNFHLALLKEYATYLQCIENKDRLAVKEEVDKLASTMTEQYSFGTKFVQDIHKFINDQFTRPSSKVVNKIRQHAQLSEDDYIVFSDTLKRSNIFSMISDRFKALL